MFPMLPRKSMAWVGQRPFPALPLRLELSGDCFWEKNPNILSPVLTLLIGSNSLLLAHPWEYARRGELISFPEISIPILAPEEPSHPRALISCIWNEVPQSIPELCEQPGLRLQSSGDAAGLGHKTPRNGVKHEMFHSCLSHRGGRSRYLFLQLRDMKIAIF